jgi:hypothetical protein
MPTSGVAVSLEGDTAIVGASGHGNGAGRAYVFVREDGAWTQRDILRPYDGSAWDRFGCSASLDAGTVVMGAYRNDDLGENSGCAYVFTSSDGVWTQQAKLLPDDGAAEDFFGLAVALEGDTAVVGADGDDDNGSRSGSAYVFTRTDGVWTQQAKLLPDDGAAYANFGDALSVDGDTAIVGAYWDDHTDFRSGSAYVFVRDSGVWTQQAKLSPEDAGRQNFFGESVAVDGDTAFVGATQAGRENASSGAVYVFGRDDGHWVEQARFLPSDGAAQDDFGASISLDGDTLIAAALFDDVNGVSSGSAYILNPASVGHELPPCNVADLAAPHGLLDLQDIYAFIGSYQDGCTISAPIEPISAHRSYEIELQVGGQYEFYNEETTDFGPWIHTTYMGQSVIDEQGVDLTLWANICDEYVYMMTNLSFRFRLAAPAVFDLEAYADETHYGAYVANNPRFGVLRVGDASGWGLVFGDNSGHISQTVPLTPGEYYVSAYAAGSGFDFDCSSSELSCEFFVTDWSCSPGDIAEPFGVIDLGDINAFVSEFLAGCP